MHHSFFIDNNSLTFYFYLKNILKMNELSIMELESCLNLNQILIDNVVRSSKINDIQNIQIQKKLNELNKQREIIIKQVEIKLNEICSE